MGIFAENADVLQPVVQSLGRQGIVLTETLLSRVNDDRRSQTLDYVLVDLCDIVTDQESSYRQGAVWLGRIYAAAALLKPNSYLTIFLRNHDADHRRVPFAWEFGKLVGSFLMMKDEKIGCEIEKPQSTTATSKRSSPPVQSAITQSGPRVVYCLNFRRESEKLLSPPRFTQIDYLDTAEEIKEKFRRCDQRAWLVVKPPAREKNVLLHPAKFPEPLIQHFIEHFTQPGERVFDPMAGTGSALIAAISCHREAYGTELNPAFCQIIRQRLEKLSPSLPGLFETPKWQIQCGDANAVEPFKELPDSFHYIITSPPYWDMLRMKGAETQQKRKQAGFLQFYSDDARDLGNIASYEDFLESLVNVYRLIGARLEPGRYLTIIVKNVKKKGQIFPLAWDLVFRLRQDFVFHREQFWCQDDQKLAPFGYRYAWVSNTFHHYCLHFYKPAGGGSARQ